MKNLLAVVLSFALLIGFAVKSDASSCTGYKVTNECIPAENILDGTLGAAVNASGGAIAPYTFSGGSVSILGAGNGIGTAGPSSIGSVAAQVDKTFLVQSTSAVSGHKILTVQSSAGAEVFSVKGDNSVLAVGAVSVATMSVTGGPVQPYSRTIAQLMAIPTLAVGDSYFCNNCSPLKIVIATGTSVGNWADAVGGTFK